jgi:hypothetical protein
MYTVAAGVNSVVKIQHSVTDWDLVRKPLDKQVKPLYNVYIH